MSEPRRYDARLTIDGIEDVPVSVYYRAWPAHIGKTDGRGGCKLEPDESAGLEIDWCELEDGRHIELTTAEENAVLEEINLWLSGYYDEPEPEGENA